MTTHRFTRRDGLDRKTMPIPNAGTEKANMGRPVRLPLRAADVAAATVSFAVTVFVGVTLLWSKLQVMPVGTPGHDRSTLALNPFAGVIVKV
jgi:hypothetical protein